MTDSRSLKSDSRTPESDGEIGKTQHVGSTLRCRSSLDVTLDTSRRILTGCANQGVECVWIIRAGHNRSPVRTPGNPFPSVFRQFVQRKFLTVLDEHAHLRRILFDRLILA